MASREGDGRQDGRHRRVDEPRATRSARTQPSRRPPKPSQPSQRQQARPARAPFAARDTLSPLGAQRATRFTRITFALIADLLYGAGFYFGVSTDSSTYRAMQAALIPLLGEHSGMWAWGTVLVVAGVLIPTGHIAVGGVVGFFGWSAFAVFNLLSGAWGVFFVAIAVLHLGMAWYIARDRRRATRSARDG